MLHIEESLLEVDRDGTAVIVASNTSKTSHLLKKGEELRTVQDVSMANLPKFKLCHVLRQLEDTSDVVEDDKFTNERVQWRRQQMKLLCNVNPNLTLEESSQLAELLASHPDVFSLEEGE